MDNKQMHLARARQEILAACYRGLDGFALRREVARVLQAAVGFSGCSLPAIDPESYMVTSSFTRGLPEDNSRAIMYNEFAENDVHKIPELASRRNPVGILSHALAGNPGCSLRHQKLLRPRGWVYELRAALVTNGQCWGAIGLHRTRDYPDFSPEEAAFLAGIGPHIAEGLRRAVLAAGGPTGVDPDTAGPGLVLLDGQDRVLTTTPAGERMLAELVEPDWPRGVLPPVLFALAARVRARSLSAAGPGGPPARLRLRARSGRWLVFQAAPAQGAMAGNIAIVAEQARPPEVAPLIMHAYGLSDREIEVVRLVMAGYATRDLAAALYISEHTVQDHLKSVFAKTGVSSRRELTGQVFLSHCYPELADPQQGGRAERLA